VVVVAGRGHETEQVGPNGSRSAFSDREIAARAAERRLAS
jgi:UDP-N-acetylmuramyl tripeptide synthase